MSSGLLISILLCQVTSGLTYVTNKTSVQLASSMTDNPVRHLENIECEAHEEITSTDLVNHQYKPYYVKLFRCQGADYSHAPTHRSCKPIKSHVKEVKIGIFRFDGTYDVISMFNHTKCEYTCKENFTTCNKYQKWNEDRCQCTCDPSTRKQCREPKIWNSFRCCTCSPITGDKCEERGKVLDPENCLCVPAIIDAVSCTNKINSLHINHVIVVVSVELIIVVIICSLVFYHCCYKKNTGDEQLVDGDDEEFNMNVIDSKPDHVSSKNFLTR